MKRNKTRLLLILLLAAALFLAAGSALLDQPEDATGLSDEDRAELIRLTLERALVAQEIPDYALLPDPNNVVLSTENVDPTLVPSLRGIDLEVMTPAEIQERADGEGDFLYLRFDEITPRSADEVIVRLSNTWAVATASEQGYLSGGGFAVEYSRDGDGWSGEVTELWIS